MAIYFRNTQVSTNLKIFQLSIFFTCIGDGGPFSLLIAISNTRYNYEG